MTALAVEGKRRTEDPRVLRSARRAACYDAQRTLWRVTGRKRLAFCGRIVSSNADGVTIKVTGAGTDKAAAGFSGLQTCGSVWACPVCSEKVNAERQHEIETGIHNWLDEGNSILFGTFTLRHDRTDGLADLWDAISPAWAKTVGGSSWHGNKRTTGDKHRFNVAGWARVVEVKDGANGWHPHIHVLFFLRGKAPSKNVVTDLRRRLFGRWESALAARGYSVLDRVGVDLRAVGDAEALGSYFAKNTYAVTSPGAAAYEVTGSQSKRQGKGGETPFQLLARLVTSADRLEQLQTGEAVDKVTGEILGFVDVDKHFRDLARWREWEEASAGRRQLTWSKGLRALLGLDVERTDEEIAEDDSLAGEDVVTFTKVEWKAGGLAYKRAQLLDLAETDRLRDYVLGLRVELELMGGEKLRLSRIAG